GTVLAVDSEEAICNVVRQTLERTDYRVLEVHDAEEALQICREQMEQIDLLLAEVTLPRVSGRTLVEWAASLFLGSVVLRTIEAVSHEIPPIRSTKFPRSCMVGADAGFQIIAGDSRTSTSLGTTRA